MTEEKAQWLPYHTLLDLLQEVSELTNEHLDDFELKYDDGLFIGDVATGAGIILKPFATEADRISRPQRVEWMVAVVNTKEATDEPVG